MGNIYKKSAVIRNETKVQIKLPKKNHSYCNQAQISSKVTKQVFATINDLMTLPWQLLDCKMPYNWQIDINSVIHPIKFTDNPDSNFIFPG